MEIMSNPIILLAITFGIYYVARQIQKWTGWIVLNPILITIAALIALLQLTESVTTPTSKVDSTLTSGSNPPSLHWVCHSISILDRSDVSCCPSSCRNW